MEPCKIRGTTQPLVSRTGAGRQGNIFSFRSREKNVLDFSSYRSGFINSRRFGNFAAFESSNYGLKLFSFLLGG